MVQELNGRHAAATTRASAMLASETAQMLINMWGDAAGALAVIVEETRPARAGESSLDGLRRHVRDRPALPRRAPRPGAHGARGGAGPPAAAARGGRSRPEPVQSASRHSAGRSPALERILENIDRLDQIGMDSPAHDLRSEAAQAAVYAGDFRVAVALADFVLERPASHRARLQAAVRRAEALTYLGDFDLARASLELAAGVTPGDRADQSERLMTELEMAYWSGAAGAGRRARRRDSPPSGPRARRISPCRS